jgi:6-phosphogluconolactonase
LTHLTSCDDAETVAARACENIVRRLAEARRARGMAHLALSGGSSPTRTYQLLAEDPASLQDVAVWFADERCVPPEDEQSNYKLAAECLLEPAAIPPRRVHRMEGELGPTEGARRYAEELAAHITPVEHGLPVLDLVVLGIGPDGHVASLFPGAAALVATEQALCLGVWDAPKPPPERITLSLAMLRVARSCLLLATGAAKADAVNAMLAEPSPHVPASLLRRERLTVIVDDAACPTPVQRRPQSS